MGYYRVRKNWNNGKWDSSQICAYTDKQKAIQECTEERVQQRYKTELNIDDQDDIQWGLLQFMAYILDDRGFTEHGSSIGGCWLTEKGEMFLTVLDAWDQYNKEN